MKLFEYNSPLHNHTGIYVVAKNIQHALTKLIDRYPEAIKNQIIETNGDILEVQYADSSETFNSGVK